MGDLGKLIVATGFEKLPSNKLPNLVTLHKNHFFTTFDSNLSITLKYCNQINKNESRVLQHSIRVIYFRVEYPIFVESAPSLGPIKKF